MLKPIDLIVRGGHDTGRTTIASFIKNFLNENGYRDVTVQDSEPLPVEEKSPFWDRLQRNRTRPVRIRVELDSAVSSPADLIAKVRRDAENPSRDNNHPGIDMLRSWLRHLHMQIVIGGDYQDMSQEEIATRLGEKPIGKMEVK